MAIALLKDALTGTTPTEQVAVQVGNFTVAITGIFTGSIVLKRRLQNGDEDEVVATYTTADPLDRNGFQASPDSRYFFDPNISSGAANVLLEQ